MNSRAPRKHYSRIIFFSKICQNYCCRRLQGTVQFTYDDLFAFFLTTKKDTEKKWNQKSSSENHLVQEAIIPQIIVSSQMEQDISTWLTHINCLPSNWRIKVSFSIKELGLFYGVLKQQQKNPNNKPCNSVLQDQFNYQKYIHLKILFLMHIHKVFRTVK